MEYKKDNGGREKYFPCKLKKDRTSDCVVRAIAIATDTDYLIIWKELFKIGLEIGHLPSNKRTTEKYLDSIGWVKNKPFRKSNGRKYKLRNVPIDNNKSYIFQTTTHWTAIKKGIHRDTWNCQDWCANSYYTKKES